MKVRRRKKPAAEEETKTGMGLDGFLNHGKARVPKAKRKRETLTDLEVAMDDANRRGRSGDWDSATGKSFVGLYAICFRMVYGEAPLPMTDKGAVIHGARMATSVLHKHFEDDKDDLVEFIKWAWGREKGKHNWALGQGVDRKPMGVGLQFSTSMIQEYRVHLRSGRRGRKH